MGWLTDITEEVGIDAYTMRARIQPAMLVVLPIALGVLVLDPQQLILGRAAWSLVAWAGGTALVAQLARDRGKLLEPSLFQRWGGAPSTLGLRFSGAKNPSLVQLRHEQLRRLLPETSIPDAATEAANPSQADMVYDTCVRVLRDRTRDKARYPLVFEENCNYGFRRNTLGMRPFGIISAALGTGSSVPAVLSAMHDRTIGANTTGLAVALISLALLVVWLFVISERWARIPAEAYVDRLFEASESLASTPSGGQ